MATPPDGPFAMWENDSELQGKSWDESNPRSADTAALWHIGARVANEDECRSICPLARWPARPLVRHLVAAGVVLPKPPE